MDRNTTLIIITGLISGCILLGTLAQAAVTIYSRRRQREVPDKALARLEERLSRIEQAVEAIAVEVERVSEGQRFTTRLLAERHAGRA